MLEQRGFDRGSVISGSSVQNRSLACETISAVVETLLVPDDIISILVDKNFTMNATGMVLEVSHKNPRYQYNMCIKTYLYNFSRDFSSSLPTEMYGQQLV